MTATKTSYPGGLGRRDEKGEGVISAAIAVLIMAFIADR
jgi:hypothetical protein